MKNLFVKRVIRNVPPFRWLWNKKRIIDEKIIAEKRAPYVEQLKLLLPKDVCVISSNCFAGRIMQDLQMQYNSPTVGLWIMPDDYPVFCRNLRKFLKADITIVKHSKNALGEMRHNSWDEHPYPIGLIDNSLEVHFLHYKTEREALDKWKRRAQRVNYNNVLIVGMEQNGCTLDDIVAFDSIPYPAKVFFATKPYPYKSVIYLPEFKESGCVGDPYRESYIFYKHLIDWLKKNDSLVGCYGCEES